MRTLSTGLVLGLLFSLPGASLRAAEMESRVGRQIPDFKLKDFRGREHSLSDLQDSRLVVVAFVGTECPLAKLYTPRMQQLSEQFADRGVAFLAINSNRQDSITELAAHARIHGLTMPLLKDLNNEVADLFGATRTPELFVLDQDRIVRYHGRIDDQYSFDQGLGYQKPKIGRADLTIAIEELLDDKEVSVAFAPAKGCIIGRTREANEDSEVTYSNQISRLFQNRCVECHREGQIAPFSLTSYADAVGWGEMVQEVVREQRMPPWHANPEIGVFANDLHLSEEEKELIDTWVANGCPEGDPAQLPDPIEYPTGWMLPHEPDMVVYIQDEPVKVQAEGTIDYQYYEVDPGFTEDKWVKVAECLPDNHQVVHHIIVYVRPPQKGKRSADRDIRGFGFLSGYAPGTRPYVYPSGMAKLIPAGSKLVFQMHYTACGSEQLDRSGVGIIFCDEDEVTHQVATTNAAAGDFAIPPFAPNHKVDAERTFTRDTLLLSLFPHMHLRGKSFRYDVTYPDGTTETLLDVPRYDFNWQYYFILDEPKLLPKGTTMHCTAYFDNSEDNLANPDPTETVRWGDQTWEEMMIGWFDCSFPLEQAAALQQGDADNAADDAEPGDADDASGD